MAKPDRGTTVVAMDKQEYGALRHRQTGLSREVRDRVEEGRGWEGRTGRVGSGESRVKHSNGG